MYADRDVPAVVEPAKTLFEERWMINRPVNNGTPQEPRWVENWVGPGVYIQNERGEMVPRDNQRPSSESSADNPRADRPAGELLRVADRHDCASRLLAAAIVTVDP